MPMLTTSPHLYIRRPSPTTAEFTVTTCPPLTLPLRLLLFALSLLRLALLSAALLTLHARLAHRLPFLASTAPTTVQFPSSSSSPSAPPETTTSTLLQGGGGIHPFLLHQHHHHQSPNHRLQQHAAAADTPSLLTLLLTLDIPTLLSALVTSAAHSRPAFLLARLLRPVPDAAAVLAALFIAYFAVCWRLHRTESVLVLRGLGIQTSSARGMAVEGLLTFGGAGWTTSSGNRTVSVGVGGGGGVGMKGDRVKDEDDGLVNRSLARLKGWVLRGLTLGWGAWGAQTRFIPTEKIRDVLINEAFRGFEVRYYLIVVVEGEEELVVLFPQLLPRRKIVEAVWRGVRGCLWEGEGWEEAMDDGERRGAEARRKEGIGMEE
ncbi:hypothetical protein VTJ04DRAFT_8913 [Mycothermus thermophilus]|uniref:uncharacterized protein n=1 Tax=Humicola insolens TaxID=85995 RepID=UPI0037426EDB